MTAVARRPIPDAAPTNADRIAEGTIVLELTKRKPWLQRAIRTEDVIDPTDTVAREAIHATKELFDPKRVSRINALDTTITEWLGRRSVPCDMLAPGMYAIPLALFSEVDAEVERYATERDEMVESDLLRPWSKIVAEAETKLGKHFNARDYWTRRELKGKFAVRKRWLSFNVPAALRGIDEAAYTRELERQRAEWASAAVEMQTTIREGFAALIQQAAERLGRDTDGKLRTFRKNDATLDDLKDFLSVFDARNLTGDTTLAALAQKARGVLDGVDPEQLRGNAASPLRERIAGSMTKITESLTSLGVTVPSTARKLRDREG